MRSSDWFGRDDRNGFIHRSWMQGQGFPPDVLGDRPVVGICNSWSELTPCNAHLRRVADAVKRGVWEAGGFPVEFPTMSLGEPLMRPTAMLFRNLMSMDVEESIRANPLDAVVLLSGCDKTVPAQLMGAASVDLPTILLTGGPMLNGKYQGRDIGSGTAVWQFSEDRRAGRITAEECRLAESCMSRSNGHCMTMGTASTMASVGEALGIALPGAAAVPAVDSRRYHLAHEAGRRAVAIVDEELRPSTILTSAAFENAIRVVAAIGGSTNAIIHLLAIAGRVGVPLTLEDFDKLSRDVPMLVDLMPSGRFLMEDFYYAGGVPTLMHEIRDLLHLEQITVNGKTVGENLNGVTRVEGDEVIRPFDRPVLPDAGIAILRGNLCPDGAVLKRSAADPDLMRHRGRAIAFDSIEEYDAWMDRDDIEVEPSDVLVLKNAGPRGYPGMPEVGNLGIPRRLSEQGVKDMVRISDARMSGTSYGTVVLHVAPEAAAGGPLALVETGDVIVLDVPARTLQLEVAEDELERRRARWQTPASSSADRGYVKLFNDHVLQADRGVDFDFLVGASGDEVPRQSH